MESAKKSVKVGSGNAYDAKNIYAHLASAYYFSEEILIFQDYLNMSLLQFHLHYLMTMMKCA